MFWGNAEHQALHGDGGGEGGDTHEALVSKLEILPSVLNGALCEFLWSPAGWPRSQLHFPGSEVAGSQGALRTGAGVVQEARRTPVGVRRALSSSALSLLAAMLFIHSVVSDSLQPHT